jgi:hypothetical protein
MRNTASSFSFGTLAMEKGCDSVGRVETPGLDKKLHISTRTAIHSLRAEQLAIRLCTGIASADHSQVLSCSPSETLPSRRDQHNVLTEQSNLALTCRLVLFRLGPAERGRWVVV